MIHPVKIQCYFLIDKVKKILETKVIFLQIVKQHEKQKKKFKVRLTDLQIKILNLNTHCLIVFEGSNFNKLILDTLLKMKLTHG